MSAVEDLIHYNRQKWISVGPVRNMVSAEIPEFTGIEVHHQGVTKSWPLSDAECLDGWQSDYYYHINTRKYPDIWYHLGITTSGQLTTLRSPYYRNVKWWTWRTRKLLTVNFPGNDQATDAQFETLHKLRRALQADGGGTDLRYHAERQATACPGPETIHRLKTMQAYPIEDIPTHPPRQWDPGLRLLNVVFSCDAPGGGGYMLQADGGVITVGSAPFFGSAAGKIYNIAEYDSMVVDTDGQGYTLYNVHGQPYRY